MKKLLFILIVCCSLNGFGQLDTIIVRCSDTTDYFFMQQWTKISQFPPYDTTNATKEEIELWKKLGKSEGGFFVPDSLVYPSMCGLYLDKKWDENFYLKVYDYKSTLRLEGEYLGYKECNITVTYFPSGERAWVRYYKVVIDENGKTKSINNGTWVHYKENGKIRRREIWKNGRLIKKGK